MTDLQRAALLVHAAEILADAGDGEAAVEFADAARASFDKALAPARRFTEDLEE